MRHAIAVMLLVLVSAPAGAELDPTTKEKLATSEHVYIASTRKSGELGEPAEIWFLWHEGAVYVGTPPSSWRVKRIEAGRPRAKIAVGKPDGPSFWAKGAIVDEPDTLPVLYETFARKYPGGWKRFESEFREGFENGNRVLVRYTPE